MLNLNPELVDQDKIRKAKRKRLLKYVSVPCILLLLASVFLKENPPTDVICRINTNLSLSVEMQADRAYNSERYDDALVLYGKAQSALYANGCASKFTGEGKDKKSIEAKERIDTKLSKTMNKINSRNADEEGGQGHDTGYSMSETQKERLNNRREAQNEVNWQLQNAFRGSKSYGCNDPEYGLREICW